MSLAKIEWVLLPANVTAGANPLVLMSLAYAMRTTTWEPEPIEVRREGQFLRIVDGRHRFMAAVIAGRSSVPYVEVP